MRPGLANWHSLSRLRISDYLCTGASSRPFDFFLSFPAFSFPRQQGSILRSTSSLSLSLSLSLSYALFIFIYRPRCSLKSVREDTYNLASGESDDRIAGTRRFSIGHFPHRKKDFPPPPPLHPECDTNERKTVGHFVAIFARGYRSIRSFGRDRTLGRQTIRSFFFPRCVKTRVRAATRCANRRFVCVLQYRDHQQTCLTTRSNTRKYSKTGQENILKGRSVETPRHSPLRPSIHSFSFISFFFFFFFSFR